MIEVILLLVMFVVGSIVLGVIAVDALDGVVDLELRTGERRKEHE